MSMSDPLADMLTRIRNAVMVKFDSVEMPSSNTRSQGRGIHKRLPGC